MSEPEAIPDASVAQSEPLWPWHSMACVEAMTTTYTEDCPRCQHFARHALDARRTA